MTAGRSGRREEVDASSRNRNPTTRSVRALHGRPFMVPHVQAQTNRSPVASALTTTEAPKRMLKTNVHGARIQRPDDGSVNGASVYSITLRRGLWRLNGHGRHRSRRRTLPMSTRAEPGPSLLSRPKPHDAAIGQSQAALGLSASSPRPSGGRDAQAVLASDLGGRSFLLDRLFPDRVDDIAHLLIVEQ